MKVALASRAVFPFHGFGGLERHVASLKRHLELAGCQVTLYTSPPTWLKSANAVGTNVVQIPYRKLPWPRRAGFTILDRDTNYLIWSWNVGAELLKSDADIIQADGGAGFGYAWRRGGDAPPLVLHPHGMEEFKAPAMKRLAYWPLRKAIRFAASRAERVLSPDDSMANEVRSHLGVEASRLAVVPNAIDLEACDAQSDSETRNDILAQLHLDRLDFVLLSVGRLQANKGFEVLVQALADPQTRLPPRWRWLLVGDGPARTELKRAVERQGLDGRVSLTGSLSDDELRVLYQRADLFVHPTLYEGSSLTTLEAMAHRKAIVASAVGGIPDKIDHQRQGLLVPPGDARALSEALSEATHRESSRKEWGEQARARVEERFSWATRVRELMGFYEEVIREGRRG